MVHRRQDSPRAEPWFGRLRLTNVRCFEDTVVPLDRRVTVILGENGAGKTTIAEALASLSFGDDEGLEELPFRRDGGSGHIALFEGGAKSPAARWVAGRSALLREDASHLAYCVCDRSRAWSPSHYHASHKLKS